MAPTPVPSASPVSSIEVRQVDFSKSADVEAMIAMVDAYACDEMGGSTPLAESIRAQIAERFPKHPAALAWVAWMGDQPVGTAVALWAFSTFAARPRINVHDMSVAEGHRDLGIGRKLLEAVEVFGRENDCCAITLEVRADNHRAKHLYNKLGYVGATDWSPPETFAYWEKKLV